MANLIDNMAWFILEETVSFLPCYYLCVSVLKICLENSEKCLTAYFAPKFEAVNEGTSQIWLSAVFKSSRIPASVGSLHLAQFITTLFFIESRMTLNGLQLQFNGDIQKIRTEWKKVDKKGESILKCSSKIKTNGDRPNIGICKAIKNLKTLFKPYKPSNGFVH